VKSGDKKQGKYKLKLNCSDEQAEAIRKIMEHLEERFSSEDNRKLFIRRIKGALGGCVKSIGTALEDFLLSTDDSDDSSAR